MYTPYHVSPVMSSALIQGNFKLLFSSHQLGYFRQTSYITDYLITPGRAGRILNSPAHLSFTLDSQCDQFVIRTLPHYTVDANQINVKTQ